jgi:hypothetical protein
MFSEQLPRALSSSDGGRECAMFQMCTENSMPAEGCRAAWRVAGCIRQLAGSIARISAVTQDEELANQRLLIIRENRSGSWRSHGGARGTSEGPAGRLTSLRNQ